MKRAFLICVILLVAAIIFALGMFAHARRWPPAVYLSQIRNAILAFVGEIPLDIQVGTSNRVVRACPQAGPRTMVALIFGQSHSANTVGERFAGNRHVYNYFLGRCYEAHDPLLGANKDYGNLWTLIGNDLTSVGGFDDVVLLTVGISGSTIGRWAPGGDLHNQLVRSATSLRTELEITHVFIQQGEADLIESTNYDTYYLKYAEVINSLRQMGIRAPIFVSIESGYCDEGRSPAPLDNAVVTAQQKLFASNTDIFRGPNMDIGVNSESDRYDGCHMSGAGARKLSQLWLPIIIEQKNRH